MSDHFDKITREFHREPPANEESDKAKAQLFRSLGCSGIILSISVAVSVVTIAWRF